MQQSSNNTDFYIRKPSNHSHKIDQSKDVQQWWISGLEIGLSEEVTNDFLKKFVTWLALTEYSHHRNLKNDIHTLSPAD